MELFEDDKGYVDMQMIQTVVGMLGRNPRLQRIVRYGLQGHENMDEDSESDEDSYERYHGIRFRDTSNGGRFRGNLPSSYLPVYRGPYYNNDDLSDSSLPPESGAVRKKEEKAEKKKLKRQNQKRKKQLEKEKQNAHKPEVLKNEAQQPTAEVDKPEPEKPKDDGGPSVEKVASAKETEITEDEYSGTSGNEGDSFETENLDMNSSFVNTAALIAMRKVEQKPQAEKKKKKKKVAVKEKPNVPATTNKKPEDEQEPEQASAALSVPTLEDNIKLSTELAVIGNGYASSGDFGGAVEYFTHAIKYNPTEFKLFGNRSFCFEKMKEYEKALTDAEVCLTLYPGWVKGEYRKGRALAGLKRYQEAAQSFSRVLQLDGSYAEAAHELLQMQITQLMECGFTREQSSNALIIHGSVEKALAVLSKLKSDHGAFQTAPQVVNVSGVSPILSAANSPLKTKHLGPPQTTSNVQAEPEPDSYHATNTRNGENGEAVLELFPIWVGNLAHRVTPSVIVNLFRKVGAIYSVKLLSYKCCAFVNFTKKEHCEEAIRRFNGFELNGMKMAVRYPDRIPSGLGISRSALKAKDLHNEKDRHSTNGNQQPARSPKPVTDHKDNSKI